MYTVWIGASSVGRSAPPPPILLAPILLAPIGRCGWPLSWGPHVPHAAPPVTACALDLMAAPIDTAACAHRSAPIDGVQPSHQFFCRRCHISPIHLQPRQLAEQPFVHNEPFAEQLPEQLPGRTAPAEAARPRCAQCTLHTSVPPALPSPPLQQAGAARPRCARCVLHTVVPPVLLPPPLQQAGAQSPQHPLRWPHPIAGPALL
jgi:hypothetical protein